MLGENLPIGELFCDRYQIEQLLRRGRLSQVYRALDQSTGGLVAIKRVLLDIPKPSSEEDRPYLAEHFQAECGLLQNLKVPGIPPLVDSFVEGDKGVLVTEFIEGVDLEKQVGPALPVEGALEYTIQVARILESLHALRPRPVLHQNVKPANIILRPSDHRPFLVDFGLKRGLDAGRNIKTAMTSFCCTPLEQYQGQPTTRSDQYALGATLHFLLTGVVSLPFQIEPLKKFRPDVPWELYWAVGKATERAQEQRFDLVYEFRSELEGVLAALHK